MKFINFIGGIALLSLIAFSIIPYEVCASDINSSFSILKALNQEIGENDFRISFTGDDSDWRFDSSTPDVAYNSSNNEYLVVWHGSNTLSDTHNEYEIFGQRFNAQTGDRLGDQIRISFMGTDGDHTYHAFWSAIAYNSLDNEYMVVWHSDTLDLADIREKEIFGQRIDSDGTLLGDNFRISYTGPDGNPLYEAIFPDIVYNSQDNEYLVVWEGSSEFLAIGEEELFGKLLNADGTEIVSDFRISAMGTDGATEFLSRDPALAYNSNDNQYLVAWNGEDDAAELNPNVSEVFIEILGADGTVIVDDQYITIPGPLDDNSYYVSDPAVAYNSRDNQYLVTWEGSDDSGDEVEILGQIINADGSQVGDDFRISNLGSDETSPDFEAVYPSVSYNPTYNEYLVTWSGNDDRDPALDPGEVEVYVKRLASDGLELTDDIRISDMGGLGDPGFKGDRASSASNTQNGEYLIVWDGREDTEGLDPNKFEIYGQRFVGASCGDGELDAGGEECDDGNTEDGDGCSSNCLVEVADDTVPGNGCTLVEDARGGKEIAVLLAVFLFALFILRASIGIKGKHDSD